MQGKVATLELRVSPAVKELVRQAAACKGQTMSEFVLSVVEPVATDIVEGQPQIRLSERAWAEFVEHTTRYTRATPLAKSEAAEFLARLGTSE